MKRCLTDIRNPARWARPDYDRCADGDMAIVSTVWERPPFGLRKVRTLPHVQPGIFRVDGKPAGLPHTFNAEFGALVDANPTWSQFAGHRLTLWSSGNQTVTAVDLTRLDVIEAWTDHLLAHFAWAGGVHHDYFTTLAWLAEGQGLPIPPEFWRAWDVGYSAAIQRMKLRRPDWIILGQQYHLTRLTPYADGLYVEEHPQFSGTLVEEHLRNMEKHGGAESWVFEFRSGFDVPPELNGRVSAASWKSYVESSLATIVGAGAWISWRRDASALVGIPA